MVNLREGKYKVDLLVCEAVGAAPRGEGPIAAALALAGVLMMDRVVRTGPALGS
jgi:hypothetical protein